MGEGTKEPPAQLRDTATTGKFPKEGLVSDPGRESPSPRRSTITGGKQSALGLIVGLLALVLGPADALPQTEAVVPIVINEIDYDQPGTDTAEFIELENIGSEAVNLGGVTLDLVNGTGGGASIYQSIALPDFSLRTPRGPGSVSTARAMAIRRRIGR
jgi:hypothetical protein